MFANDHIKNRYMFFIFSYIFSLDFFYLNKNG